MYCGKSNNDPRIVTQYYINAVRSVQGQCVDLLVAKS